jgi:predicted PurR-regulated permease PerM
MTVAHKLKAAETRSIVLWTLVAAALGTVMVYGLYLVRHVLLLIYISMLLAIGFSPIVRAIERQTVLPIRSGIPRGWAIAIVYFAILGVLAGVALTILPAAVEQTRQFVEYAPRLLSRLETYLRDVGVLGPTVDVEDVVQKMPAGRELGGPALGALVGTVWGVLAAVFSLLTVLILSLYMLIESRQMFQTYTKLFPARRRAQAEAAAVEITEKVSAWLSGQLILSFIIGATTAVALGLLGVPFFYVLAVLAAAGELIPFIGPVLAAIPAILVGGSVSLEMAGVVLVFFVLQQQIENHLLVPKLMEHQVGLNAVTVIIAVLVGGALLGVLGILLAVPTAAIVQVLLLRIVTRETVLPR